MKKTNLLIIFFSAIFLFHANICLAEEISSISSISKMELYEKNTDSSPEMDALQIYVIFGDTMANRIKPRDGVNMNYHCKIFNYKGGSQGALIAEDKGILISRNGYTSFLIKLPGVTEKTRVLAEVIVTLPNGKTVHGKSSDTFNPEKY